MTIVHHDRDHDERHGVRAGHARDAPRRSYYDDDPLTAFFNKSGIASVKTILEFPTKAFAKPWVYKNASGNDLEVPVAKNILVWIFVDYHNHLSNTKGAAATYEEYIRVDFEDYRINTYDPDSPVKRFTNRAAAVPVLTAPELAQMRKDDAKAAYFTEQALALRTSAARNTAASDFRKGIKGNKDDYDEFKREEFWDGKRPKQ